MPVPRISPEDLQQALSAADPEARPILVDARLKYPFEHSTLSLPGAIRLAGEDTMLPPGRRVVVYDSDPDELAGSTVAARLIRAGREAAVLRGGIAAWLAAGGPTDTKPAPRPAAPSGSLKT